MLQPLRLPLSTPGHAEKTYIAEFVAELALQLGSSFNSRVGTVEFIASLVLCPVIIKDRSMTGLGVDGKPWL